jgi:tetraacyldisaccharide 4'-kinase
MSVNTWQNRLSPILAPLSLAYSLCVARKQKSGLEKSEKLPLPVISIGNIAMGGTGKTPVCEYLAGRLAETGIKGVILSRGYKATPGTCPFLVDPDGDPLTCGDEPLMLARSLQGRFQVVVDPVRLRGGEWAMRNLDPQVFILDDGFQHVLLRRDMNILLLTPHDLGQGWDRVFPAGMWREGKKALTRADLFLVNTLGQGTREISALAEKRAIPAMGQVFFFSLEALGLEDLSTGEESAGIDSRPYLLVTGVAGPERVYKTAADMLGRAPAVHLVFNDHHPFGPGSMRRIKKAAASCKVRDIVCTAKDAVKLSPAPGLRFHVIRTTLRFEDDGQSGFLKRVREVLAGY